MKNIENMLENLTHYENRYFFAPIKSNKYDIFISKDAAERFGGKFNKTIPHGVCIYHKDGFALSSLELENLLKLAQIKSSMCVYTNELIELLKMIFQLEKLALFI